MKACIYEGLVFQVKQSASFSPVFGAKRFWLTRLVILALIDGAPPEHPKCSLVHNYNYESYQMPTVSVSQQLARTPKTLGSMPKVKLLLTFLLTFDPRTSQKVSNYQHLSWRRGSESGLRPAPRGTNLGHSHLTGAFTEHFDQGRRHAIPPVSGFGL